MIARVVLDTNVVVSALLKPQGLEEQVLRLTLAGKFILCLSPPVLSEYARVLQSPKFKLRADDVTAVLKQLERTGSLFEPLHTLKISEHEPDNRLYECADAAQAAFLVTGNLKHFKRDYRITKIVTSRQLLELLSLGQV
jgi:uncharacterized protein